MNVMNIFSHKEERDTHKASPIPERLRKGQKIAIIAADKTEDTEFFYPYYRLHEAGYDVDVLTPEGGQFEAKHGLGLKETTCIREVHPQDYELIYIPGGKAPAELRKHDTVLNFVREFSHTGKPIAAICHGAQVLISAGLVTGKEMACWPEMAKELREAGGTFVDEALVVDAQFITARMPGDLHRHLYGVLQCLNGEISSHQRRQERKPDAA